jgi:hypothetical protein
MPQKKPAVTNNSRSAERIILSVILGLAVVVRIIYWWEAKASPFYDLLFLDSKVYHLLAQDIATTSFWGGGG